MIVGSRPVPPLSGSSVPCVDAYDAVLLDLDGTVYVGSDPVPGIADIVAQLHGRGLRCCYLTNNASRTAAATAEFLQSLGVPAVADDVVTSAQAAARLLAAELPAGAPVLVVGGDGLVAALDEVGLQTVRSAEDAPAAVVQGLAPDVDWRQLAEGAFAIRRGVPWLATNRDLTLPTPRGEAPGNGSLVEILRLVTGAEPRVAGKPERPLADAAIQRTGAQAPLVVGDRLDTDIACAHRAGLPSLLVLTGVTDAERLLLAAPGERPTYVSGGLDGLFVPHPGVTESGGGRWSCRGWTARVADGVLDIVAAHQAGDAAEPGTEGRYDGLRAACVATWAARDAGTDVDVCDALSVLGL